MDALDPIPKAIVQHLQRLGLSQSAPEIANALHYDKKVVNRYLYKLQGTMVVKDESNYRWSLNAFPPAPPAAAPPAAAPPAAAPPAAAPPAAAPPAAAPPAAAPPAAAPPAAAPAATISPETMDVRTPNEAILGALQALLTALPHLAAILTDWQPELTPLQRHFGRFVAYTVLRVIQHDPEVLTMLIQQERTTRVPGVMYQAVLFDHDYFDCRVHFFEDATETLIHDHKLRFQSFMLQGSYWHTIYAITAAEPSSEAPRPKYRLLLRHEGRHGRLEEADGGEFTAVRLLSHLHTPTPLPLEIHEDAVHTVRVVAATEKVVTLVVRFKPPQAQGKGVSRFYVRSGTAPLDQTGEREEVQLERVFALRRMLRDVSKKWPHRKDLDSLLVSEKALLKGLVETDHCPCPTCSSSP